MISYHIRPVHWDDPHELKRIAEIEAVCFPSAEAASLDSIRQRAAAFPESFFVAEQDSPAQGRLVGFINGCVTNALTICDEMFENVSTHCPNGAYQAVFGLDVLPDFRRQGIASGLMNALIAAARSAGRKGLILTCKEHLIPYYEKFGYRSLGVSQSVHGGAVWFDMVLEF